MRRIWLSKSKYILLISLALLCTTVFYPQPAFTRGTSRTAKQESAICNFLSSQLSHRSIDSFERDFGAIIARSERKFETPSRSNKYGTLIKLKYVNGASLSYVVVDNPDYNQVELIVEIEVHGMDNLKKLGLSVSLIGDIQDLFGKPDSIEVNVMTYRCDMSFVAFTVSPPNSLTARIATEID